MQTICSIGMFFTFMKEYTGLGWSDFVFTFSAGPWGSAGHETFGWDKSGNLLTADEFNHICYSGQSVTFITLVILQWGNVLCTRNRKLSIIEGDPFRAKRRNLWVFLGMFAAFVTAVIVTEVPAIQHVMQTGPVPLKYWLFALPLTFAVMIMEEIRKLIVRVYPKSFIAKLSC